MKGYILIRYGNRIVGKIINKQFHKWCNEKHIYNKNFGIAVSKEVLECIKEDNVHDIIINYKNTETKDSSKLLATVPQYESKGKVIIDGHGRFKDEQLCLPIKYMKLVSGISLIKADPNQTTLGIYK